MRDSHGGNTFQKLSLIKADHVFHKRGQRLYCSLSLGFSCISIYFQLTSCDGSMPMGLSDLAKTAASVSVPPLLFPDINHSTPSVCSWNVCVYMYEHPEVTSAQITSLAVNLKAHTKQTHLEHIWAHRMIYTQMKWGLTQHLSHTHTWATQP